MSPELAPELLPSVQDLFAEALRHHQANRLADAERCYRQCLSIAPGHAEALHLLGVLAHQMGRHDVAVDLIGKAIAQNGQAPAFHNNLGLALQALGAHAAAVASFGRALALKPDLADAHNNLGIARQSQGKLAEAVAGCRAALVLRPDFAEAHSNLGNALKDQGKRAEAVSAYRRALAVRPDHAEASNNLGNALKGRPAEAVAVYVRALALRPTYAEAYSNLGNALQDQGKLEAAVVAYRRALAVRPDYAEASNNLGLVLTAREAPAAAAEAYRRALAVRPDYAEAHNNLGNVLCRQEAPAEAMAAYRRALVLKPDYAEACNNLGSALTECGRSPEAVDACARALALKPDYPDGHYNLGNALRDGGRLDAAVAAYGRALTLDPTYVEAHNNRGNVLLDQGDLTDAMACFRRALALKPNDADAHNNLGMLLLLSGRYDEGWPYYDWRWNAKALAKHRRDFGRPRWQGEDLDGRTILLYAEQGLGDAIQFCRYVPLVAARRGHVLLEVPRPLMRLLAGLAGVGQMVARGDPLPPFDLQCPLLSLPRVFGTRVETIPAPIPYLAAEAERVGAWRDRLGPSGFRIGIAWQGSPGYKGDHNRSIPLACFAPLGRIPGVRLISLQKAHGLDQLERLPEGMAVETLGADFDAAPFLDTAAVLINLDLVVAVDTAVGHLAGALGRPVWLPLATMPHWIWMLERDDSPWYPRTRLFRQSAPGDWAELFERMAGALRGRVRDR